MGRSSRDTSSNAERRTPNAERRTPNAEHPWLKPYDEGSPSGLQDLERVVAQQEGGPRKA
jgi:hypothetical protein